MVDVEDLWAQRWVLVLDPVELLVVPPSSSSPPSSRGRGRSRGGPGSLLDDAVDLVANVLRTRHTDRPDLPKAAVVVLLSLADARYLFDDRSHLLAVAVERPDRHPASGGVLTTRGLDPAADRLDLASDLQHRPSHCHDSPAAPCLDPPRRPVPPVGGPMWSNRRADRADLLAKLRWDPGSLLVLLSTGPRGPPDSVTDGRRAPADLVNPPDDRLHSPLDPPANLDNLLVHRPRYVRTPVETRPRGPLVLRVQSL